MGSVLVLAVLGDPFLSPPFFGIYICVLMFCFIYLFIYLFIYCFFFTDSFGLCVTGACWGPGAAVARGLVADFIGTFPPLATWELT